MRVEPSRLDAAIDLRAADAIEEELADAVTRLDEAERTLGELEFEIAVLTKFEGVLEQARASARDRYVEAVLPELAPLVCPVWLEAELRFDADAVLPCTLERAGTHEQFAVLSGGVHRSRSRCWFGCCSRESWLAVAHRRRSSSTMRSSLRTTTASSGGSTR
ncbi:MAG: hypothetical protein F4Y02_06280 [Chloroflexi bacterium]|nr:hypothetical protein [Chloroflexota bacterium]